MKKNQVLFYLCFVFTLGCHSESNETKKEFTKSEGRIKKEIPKRSTNDLRRILSKKEVPILCYHNIRNLHGGEGENTKTYTVSPIVFAEQMKTLHKNGFHSILPDQLYDYLVYDQPLPPKPVMITFDDTHEEQYRLGASEMNKYGFKGVFFIMTVAINRPRYMSSDQITNLSNSGNVIALHTWDHHMVTNYTEVDWETQLTKPKRKLEALTGKKVNYFAYPFGLWNPPAIKKLKSSSAQLAFILSSRRDSVEPLYTVRRMIVAGNWSASQMVRAMEKTFNQ